MSHIIAQHGASSCATDCTPGTCSSTRAGTEARYDNARSLSLHLLSQDLDLLLLSGNGRLHGMGTSSSKATDCTKQRSAPPPPEGTIKSTRRLEAHCLPAPRKLTNVLAYSIPDRMSMRLLQKTRGSHNVVPGCRDCRGRTAWLWRCRLSQASPAPTCPTQEKTRSNMVRHDPVLHKRSEDTHRCPCPPHTHTWASEPT